MKSGKVRLITNDGRSFDVTNGLAACFTQTLISVDVDSSPSALTEGGDPSSIDAVNSAPRKTKKEPNLVSTDSSTSEQGKIQFMGNILRKLVITPNYELGIQSKKVAGLKSGDRASSEEELIAEEEEFPIDIMDVAE